MTAKNRATAELEARCNKIEDFLQERFNWLNYEKPPPKKKSEPSSPAPKVEKKPDRFGYTVDMAEKPQDPGQVNELCLERERKAKARNLKAIKNTTTVGQIDKYTELNANPIKLVPLSTIENGKIMAHMENQLQLAENLQYSRKDDLTQRFVYLYDQESTLQRREAGQASKTDTSRNRYNLSHENRPRTTNHSELGSGRSGFGLPSEHIAPPKMDKSARIRPFDNVNDKMLQNEMQTMSEFAKIQKEGMVQYQTAVAYPVGRMLFNKPGRTVLQHDRLPLSLNGTVKAGLDQDVLSTTDRYQQNRQAKCQTAPGTKRAFH